MYVMMIKTTHCIRTILQKINQSIESLTEVNFSVHQQKNLRFKRKVNNEIFRIRAFIVIITSNK